MADKEEKVDSFNLWKHQDERTVAKREASEFWDKGGGEVIAIDEDCATISEIYAKMLMTGMMGSAVAHASAGRAVNEQQALAMLQNATKNPKYMEQSERNVRLKQLNDQMQILEDLKNQKETIKNGAKTEL